jgi:hypothetical protein
MGHDNIVAALSAAAGQCRAGGDGDCFWDECPQEANNRANYRPEGCPLWVREDDE